MTHEERAALRALAERATPALEQLEQDMAVLRTKLKDARDMG